MLYSLNSVIPWLVHGIQKNNKHTNKSLISLTLYWI